VETNRQPNFHRSRQLHERATRLFPSGVNSAVRAGELPVPLAFSRGKGCRIFDIDGNEYIDYQLGQGALFLGHAHPGLSSELSSQLERGTHFAAQTEVEVQAGELLVNAIPSMQRVRFTNSATEAVIAALRLVRAATGRTKIIRFEGHYHGWGDEGTAGFAPSQEDWLDEHYSTPTHPSAGVLEQAIDQFLVCRFNDPEGLRALVAGRADIAAIIFEPVMCNTGCIPPTPEFVAALLGAREESGCLLIADETITGLRFGLGGAQARYRFVPDLTVVGKAIGCGVPVAAFGGRADLMNLITEKRVSHAGTLNGNPLCMSAVRYVLSNVDDDQIARVERLAAQLACLLIQAADQADLPLFVKQVGPIIYTAVSDASDLRDYRDVLTRCDQGAWATIRLNLLMGGVRVLDRGLWYLGLAHTEGEIVKTADVFAEAIVARRSHAGSVS
jgi:glutamate-1-semialdehyde 2,1-aminomutase